MTFEINWTGHRKKEKDIFILKRNIRLRDIRAIIERSSDS